jgi:hypothetical protein
MKIYSFIALLIVATLCMGGCGDGEQSVDKKMEATASESETPQLSESDIELIDVYKVGEDNDCYPEGQPGRKSLVIDHVENVLTVDFDSELSEHIKNYHEARFEIDFIERPDVACVLEVEKDEAHGVCTIVAYPNPCKLHYIRCASNDESDECKK